MATVTSPLLSIGARGQIGKSIVFSTWKGIKTAKQYVVPGNPQTTAQMAGRGVFKWTHDAYKFLPSLVQAPWAEYVKGQPLTPMNAWMQGNIPVLSGKTDVEDILFTKPVRSGPPPQSVTATPGSGAVTIAGVPPTLITGWTVTKFIAIAMQNVDPSTEMEGIISSADEDDTTPYSVLLSGLLHTQAYVCGGFFQYLRPDAQIAYGAALTSVVTTT